MMTVVSYRELCRRPKPGDRVKISDRPGLEAWNSRMDKYLSSVMTVRSYEEHEGCCKMEEDIYDFDGNSKPGWNWYMDAIEGLVVETYEDILEDPSVWTSEASLEALLT